MSNSVGSSAVTKHKQQHFRGIIRKHLSISKAINKKYPKWLDNEYYYFDLNAGPGIVKGELGSPLIFLDEAVKTMMPVKAIFCDKNKKSCRELEYYIWERNYPSRIQTTVRHGNNEKIITDYFANQKKYRFGVAYADSNGMPCFDLLAEISKVACYGKLDLLINCPAAVIKRCLHAKTTHVKNTLKQYMDCINKSDWIIREPYDKWQWTMLFALNWNGFPEFKELGFHRIESKKGKELMKLFNYTKKELDIMDSEQMELAYGE